MHRIELSEKYFEWLSDLVDPSKNYTKLLNYLYDVEFYAIMEMDENRFGDAEILRRHFIYENDLEDLDTIIDRPISVLEIMIGISYRGSQEYIGTLYDWFWDMCESLGVDDMSDEYYNEFGVSQKIFRFLNREYRENGKGGLFTAFRTDCDMRQLEIWHQLSLYLNEII